ncbi:membrane associated protein [Strigomonas culicis]|uniref:Membrane associated protein n=1 Tax=Strigomonas culicis TaxID=28005 RepID=S9UFI9_9TRYP|nr:membrane associated protein [Strigomonas culicis]|eukprot:EPY29577.1 membrane associated protein [Strigomonas culicis]
MEGQARTMKVAAEFLDKGQYYEFSVAAIHLVDLYMRAQQNYKDSAVIHTATATWCTAISDDAKRDTHTYYLLWARMERAAPPKSRKELQEEEEDNMVGEKPRGLPNNKALHRVYKMPPGTAQKNFEEYAQGYISTLFADESLVVLTKEMTETQAALPEPDSKRKRVAAIHRQPNHCLVTVWAVDPYFPGVRSPPEGFDKKTHIQKFSSVIHVGLNEQIIDAAQFDIMQQCLNINTYELDRAFPSTTSAIDIVSLKKELLNPFETAEETINYRKQLIAEAPEDDKLICEIRKALSPMGMPPGAYMKEVIANMNDHSEVIQAVHDFSSFLRTKMDLCGTKLDAMMKHPEDYALSLKAITDIECSLIAFETPEVDRDE